jgi:hypothetical protein
MTTTITNKPGKQNTVARAEGLSAGTTKHYPNASDQLAFDGGKYTITQVQTNLQKVAELRTATTDAQASAKAKVAAEETLLPPLLLFMAAYAAFVKATFGTQPDVLADFGLAPKKARKPLTTAQKAAAKAKADATRLARGTKGPVAKLGTVGNVVGVTVTPITASPDPVPAAKPAASTTVPGGSAPAAGASGTTPHS